MSKILDFITTSPIPVWAADCRYTTVDDGAHRNGPYGYECHQIHRDGSSVGWVYDTGAGYEWAGPDDSDPEPFTAAERDYHLNKCRLALQYARLCDRPRLP